MKNLLEEQIAAARQEVSSEGYPMSLGELTSMYKQKELIIRPEFQRFYRWSATQKSRLIESILLGIPLPSIFVAQTDRGYWELVDGLQRVSTVLEVQGELLTEGGERLPPFTLDGTKYLPAMKGRIWDHPDATKSLTEAQRLDLKRSKIDIKIIKRGSSPNAKFDLFQRLNSYGSTLTPQELRSALLVAVSPDFFAWVEELSCYPAFVEATQLSDSLLDERYDLELVLRFIMLHNWPAINFKQSHLKNFADVLDDHSVEMAKKFPTGSSTLEKTFKKTFDVVVEHADENIFRRWDTEKQEFRGSFLNTSFEVFALGLGFCIRNKLAYRKNLQTAVKEFWRMPKMRRGFATGRATEARLAEFVPLGRIILRLDK